MTRIIDFQKKKILSDEKGNFDLVILKRFLYLLEQLLGEKETKKLIDFIGSEEFKQDYTSMTSYTNDNVRTKNINLILYGTIRGINYERERRHKRC